MDKDEESPGLAGFLPMRPVGIEPTTSGSGGHADEGDTRQRARTIADNHAGFLSLPPSRPAWLREPILRRLGHEWGTTLQRPSSSPFCARR